MSVPAPTVTPPVPGVTLPTLDPTLPTGGVGTPPLPGPGLPGGNPTGGTGPTTGDGGAAGAPGSGADGVTGGADAGSQALTPAQERRERLAARSTPMVAGTAAARDLLDDESSPQLLAASQDFLAADQAIAEIARQKQLMAELKRRATEMAYDYRAIEYDAITARAASDTLHERYDEVLAQWVSGAREAYVTGQPASDDGVASGVTAALARLSDGGARADMRLGSLIVRREQVRSDFELVAARYNATKRAMEDVKERLAVLNALRANALQAVYAAKGSDVALNQARMVESGQLGAQINEASAALAREGSTVQGTGDFAKPLGGQITSPFGMRMHPILRYVKLHTGLDLAGGSTILAPDDGRVILTVSSTAYGNFTVIDHGIIDGKRVTTAYAHQASFLVRDGQEVAKGDQIGVVGSTGYSTGPHLQFEVREDGAVVDPLAWLTR